MPGKRPVPEGQRCLSGPVLHGGLPGRVTTDAGRTATTGIRVRGLAMPEISCRGKRREATIEVPIFARPAVRRGPVTRRLLIAVCGISGQGRGRLHVAEGHALRHLIGRKSGGTNVLENGRPIFIVSCGRPSRTVEAVGRSRRTTRGV